MGEEEKIYFPKGFLWGSSISSHQVEGDNENDWTEWEKSEKRLKYLKDSGLADKHGLENFISGSAAEHFRLYREDFRIAKELNHNSLRISLEWSRIEPSENNFSDQALAHYEKMIDELRLLGIEPLVTIWHWTMPVWLKNQGGWENPKTPELFARYCENVVNKFKDKVKIWITLNEPDIYCSQSYLVGNWPPEKKSPFIYFKVLNNLIKGHRLAYVTMHNISQDAKIGIAKNNIHFEPHKKKWFNIFNVKLAHWWWSDFLLGRIKKYQDFIGLNYYFRNILHFGKIKNENKVVSDLGWELHPEGIYHVLKDLKKYHKPVYITENGLADAGDRLRSWFIAQILQYVHQAISEGVDVRGYLHWSLIDNFEWDKGFYPRFGLVEIDYNTKERKPRESAKFYSKIIEKNHLDKSDREVGPHS